MTILYASSEAFPFAKTGGLADAVGALAQTLSRSENVYLFIPDYSTEYIQQLKKKTVDTFRIRVGKEEYTLTIKMLELSDHFRVFFVSQDLLFARKYFYGDGENDYPDNFYRFLIFQKGLIQFCLRHHLQFDIIHCHDWQTALIPLYLRYSFEEEEFAKIKTIFSIHNLGYQGIFANYLFPEMDLPDFLFSPEYLEFYGHINFLKGGVIFSDRLVTVSPSYAEEILQPKNGFGLEGLMKKYSYKLQGILNGVDYHIWDSETDPLIFQRYSQETLPTKKQNKIKFFSQEGIALSPDTPMLIFIGRLVHQKGAHLLIKLIAELAKEPVFIAVLGMGNSDYEKELKNQANRYAKKMRFFNFFSEKTAHQLQAAADIILVPSLYEPCGLNQICGLRYGTTPVVHKTGGLQDTVLDVEKHPQRGTGFAFSEPTHDCFGAAVKKALKLINDKDAWSNMQKRGMALDFSWEKASQDYLALYRKSF